MRVWSREVTAEQAGRGRRSDLSLGFRFGVLKFGDIWSGCKRDGRWSSRVGRWRIGVSNIVIACGAGILYFIQTIGQS